MFYNIYWKRKGLTKYSLYTDRATKESADSFVKQARKQKRKYAYATWKIKKEK